VCFTNRSHAVVNFYGDVTSSPAQAVRAPSTVDGVPTEIRLDWFTRGVQTHWQELGRIAQRFPLVKAGFLGPWAFWLSCAVLLILSLAAAARIVREAPR
jgi:hypothetical protein